jgi:hypothetical protein
MLDAPRQDWAFFEERARPVEAAWLRGLTTDERFALYNDMFNVIWQARRNLEGDWERLDDLRWQQKLALRLRMVEAFQKMDQHTRERTADDNTG